MSSIEDCNENATDSTFQTCNMDERSNEEKLRGCIKELEQRIKELEAENALLHKRHDFDEDSFRKIEQQRDKLAEALRFYADPLNSFDEGEIAANTLKRIEA